MPLFLDFLLFFKCVSAVLNYWARQMREDNPLKMSFDLIPRFVCTHNFGSLECGPHFFRWLIDKQRTRLAATVVALVALQLDRMLKHHFLSPCHYFSRKPCQESNKKKTKKKTNRKTSHSIIIIIMASKRENALLKHANPKTIKEYHSGSDIMAI